MELRQLSTEHEREIFARCLEEARTTRGLGFRETGRSQLGKAHLTFGNLYALFDKESEPPERMLAGFILHDLATFPQSHPKPDLSHYPPRAVIEGGELWSLSPGAGRVARAVGAAVAGILQAKAIILYAIRRPIDLTPSYAQLNFVNAGEPVRWPYAQTAQGGEIWVQPMVLEGERLEDYVRSGFDFLFSRGDRQALLFDRPFAGSPERAASSAAAASRAFVTSSPPEAEGRNGATSV